MLTADNLCSSGLFGGEKTLCGPVSSMFLYVIETCRSLARQEAEVLPFLCNDPSKCLELMCNDASKCVEPISLNSAFA